MKICFVCVCLCMRVSGSVCACVPQLFLLKNFGIVFVVYFALNFLDLFLWSFNNWICGVPNLTGFLKLFAL